MKERSFDFVLRVLRTFEEIDAVGDLWWRTGGHFDPVTFYVSCNDIFFWGTADCEEITPENIEQLDQAIRDVHEVTSKDGWGASTAVLLFCARIKGMRPQGAAYQYIDQALVHLFDAAGPERDENEPGNT